MNREMADHMLAVIRADANITGRLFHPDGSACVVGGLYADLVDVPVSELYNARTKETGREDPYDRVRDHYELTWKQINKLYQTNDRYRNTAERRAALTRLVNSWVEE